MAYESHDIIALTEIPALVTSFLGTNSWTVDATDPDAPIITLPTTATLIDWALTVDGTNDRVELSASGSAVPTSSAYLESPKLAAGTPDPEKVHLFATQGPSETPYFAIVVQYTENLFRHLYLGVVEAVGAYTGGELVSACSGPVGAVAGPISYKDYENVQYLFQSRSALRAASACGGVHVDHADNATPWRRFRGMDTADLNDMPTDAALGGIGDGINDGYLARGESPFNGANMLVSANLYLADVIGGTDRVFTPLGRAPGVRHVHMQNLTPGASISVGGVQWRVFPALSKSAETEMPAGAGDLREYETSHYFGYAYREN